VFANDLTDEHFGALFEQVLNERLVEIQLVQGLTPEFNRKKNIIIYYLKRKNI
jgi:hypothetical protein